ncbi:MAG TPA: choice-of-anchor J domain-containing protein [Bacteroidales bacterium]|nr:choice-of-anchor J domain-containing protein [Bacteroidales bacterium]
MKKILFLISSILFLGQLSFSQGLENFANYPETGSSYHDGTFLGQDGSTWSYTQSRGDSVIVAPSPTLGKNRTPTSEVTSGSIAGGIGILSFKYKQPYSTTVNLDVKVNGIVVGNVVTIAGEQGVVKNSGDITVNVPGSFTLSFVQNSVTAGQVTIDDVTWTGFGGGTPDPEPTNYPNTFTATPQGTSITLDWTDATGEQLPAGYLIKASTADDITAPADGTPVADDLDLSDGNGAKNVSYGTPTYTFSGLQTNTKYYFSIYPYTNSGQYIDYKVDGTAPSADTTTLSIISSQDFENGLDPWMQYNVIGDSTIWVLDLTHGVGGSSCMKMTGYKNGSSYNSEDWLISAPINLSDYINTSLSFQTAMNYGSDVTTWFSVLVSTDYAGSGDPNNSTWTPLTATLSPGGWAWTSSGVIDISSLSGHTFYLAFKYICNTVNARTWEVDDVVVFGKQQSNGINDPALQADAINIYPNPVKDNFTISLPEKGLSTLTLLNATGKQILQLQNLRGLTTVNTSDLPKGLYLITVQNNTLTNSITKKIVVR